MTTDPQSEQLIQVDENNKVIGSISRGNAHSSGDKIYRTVFIIVKDNKGKILLQQRSQTKDLYPGCWDLSVGGHVKYGQSYMAAAKEELREELGIDASMEDLKFLGEVLVTLKKSKEFFHVFEYKLKKDDVVDIVNDEVDMVRWMTMEEVRLSMKNEADQWYARPLQVFEAIFGEK
jgi:isopentenyl-diphosphate delta-isomerase type 1